MSKEFILLYRKVEPFLNDKKRRNDFILEVEKSYGANYEILSSSGLYQRPLLSNSPLNKLMELPDSAFVETMNLSSDMKPVAASIRNESFYLRLIFLGKFAASIKDKDPDFFKIVLAYTVLKLYSVLYLKYFTFGKANKDVMDYTINEMSNKYDLKRLGTLNQALSKLAQNTYINYESRLLKDDDNSLFEYIEGFRTRVNAFIQNIYDLFKKNMSHGLTMKIVGDSANNDEGEEFEIEHDSRSSVIANFSQSFTLWFSSSPPNKEAIRIACEVENMVSENSLTKIVNYMRDDNSYIERISSGMIGEILEETKKSEINSVVCTNTFTPFAINLFNRINNSNSNISGVREGLIYYIEKVFPEVKESSALRYRKALLVYLSVLVQINRCR